MNERKSEDVMDLSEKNLEELFASLDQVVAAMEAEDVSLEDSFQYYYKGMMLLKTCNEKIDQVEKQIQLIDEKGELHEF